VLRRALRIRLGSRAVLSRALHLSLALSVASLALPRAGDQWVCRYTGLAMSPCPCPDVGDEPAGATVGDSGCCELQRGSAEGVPAVATAASPASLRIDAPLPVQWLYPSAAPSLRTERVAARHQGPPTEPRFISHRALLI
jgi:hypothetical protein